MDDFSPGDHVRVRADCPYTLPAYARMLVGVVESRTADGMWLVRFGEDRTFPLPGSCLRRPTSVGP